MQWWVLAPPSIFFLACTFLSFTMFSHCEQTFISPHKSLQVAIVPFVMGVSMSVWKMVSPVVRRVWSPLICSPQDRLSISHVKSTYNVILREVVVYRVMLLSTCCKRYIMCVAVSRHYPTITFKPSLITFDHILLLLATKLTAMTTSTTMIQSIIIVKQKKRLWNYKLAVTTLQWPL